MSGVTARLLAGLVVLPGFASAQVVGARGLIVGMRTTTATSATDLRLSGSAFGLEGGIGLGPAVLTLRYLE